MTEAENLIPKDVLDEFDIVPKIAPKKISGGMFNRTYLTTDMDDKRWIIQSINHAVEYRVVENAVIVLDFLRSRGWPCPHYKEAKDKKPYLMVDDCLWRVMSFTENTPLDLEKADDNFYEQMGSLLARTHKDLSECDYTPEHKIEGYHEQEYYLGKSRAIDWSQIDTELEKIAHVAQDFLGDKGALFKRETQLIHSDTRVENTFFDAQMKPFLFYDYDTFMKGSVYIDIGDCIRSLILISPDTPIKEIISQFINGYNTISAHQITYDEAVLAIELLAVELTLRYLIDIVEDYYFDWDPERFDSRIAHNTMRTHRQWKSYQKMRTDLTTD